MGKPDCYYRCGCNNHLEEHCVERMYFEINAERCKLCEWRLANIIDKRAIEEITGTEKEESR